MVHKYFLKILGRYVDSQKTLVILLILEISVIIVKYLRL